MQIARVVIVRVIVDGVLGVTIVVLIGHDEVLVIYVAIFVVIFCNWRCTLYSVGAVCVQDFRGCVQNLGALPDSPLRTSLSRLSLRRTPLRRTAENFALFSLSVRGVT